MPSIDSNVTEYEVPSSFDAGAVFAFADHLARHDHSGAVVEAAMDQAFRAASLGVRRVHNLVTDEGLDALAYNHLNSDGGVIAYFEVGDSTTAPDASDTTLGNVLGSFEDLWQVAAHNHHLIGYHLSGAKRDLLGAVTVNEVGLRTNDNSGAGAPTASDDILFARAVLYPSDRKAINTTTDVIYTWSIAYAWGIEKDPTAIPSDGRVGLDFGLYYAATRMLDLTEYTAIDYLAVGSSIPTEPWVDQLGTEVYRQAETYSLSGATITLSATIALGAAGGPIVECGPAIGSTANQQVLFAVINNFTPSNNSLNATDIEIEFSFHNRFGPVAHAQAAAVSTSVTLTATAANGFTKLRDGDTAIFVFAAALDGVTLSSPSTNGVWTKEAGEIGVGAQEVAVFSFVQDGDSPSLSYVFTSSSSASLTLVAAAFRRIDSVGTVATATGAASSVPVPAAELSDAGIIVHAIMQNQLRNFTAPADYEVLEEKTTTHAAYLAYRTHPLGTVDGETVVTDGSSASYAACAIPLKRTSLDFDYSGGGDDPR